MGRAMPCELEGRAVGRAGPWEGRTGPCGPSGERERGLAEPVHTYSNLKGWVGQIQAVESSLRPTFAELERSAKESKSVMMRV
jgi:hypothetical protein